MRDSALSRAMMFFFCKMLSFSSFFHFVYFFFSEFLCHINYPSLRRDHMITFPHFSILKIACFLLLFCFLNFEFYLYMPILWECVVTLGVASDRNAIQSGFSRRQNLLSHGIKMFKDGLQIKLDQKLQQNIQDSFLPGHLSVGRPAIPVCPGLRAGPGTGSFSAKTRNVPGRLGQLVTLSLCLCPWRSH